MATTKFNFDSTVSGVFDDVDFYAGQTEIHRINGKYVFNGEIPQGGFLNIAVDVFGDNGQQIDVAYACKDTGGTKHEDTAKPSVVTERIADNRFRRVQLRITF